MKVMITILLTLVIILGAAIGVYNLTNFNLYQDSEKVAYTEVLDDKTTPTIYYYYQETCEFCNSIKDQMTEMARAINANSEINIKLVDMLDLENKDGWGDENYDYTTADLTDPSQIKITGTPSMIYVVDGKVEKYTSGGNVFDILELVNDQYSLGVTLDRSRYGKN